jgi:hypothetical protein
MKNKFIVSLCIKNYYYLRTLLYSYYFGIINNIATKLLGNILVDLLPESLVYVEFGHNFNHDISNLSIGIKNIKLNIFIKIDFLL